MEYWNKSMLKLGGGIVAIALLLAIGNCAFGAEVSIIKPLAGKHYKERNHKGLDWNENYWDSLGVGYRHDSGFGGQVIYVNENSVNKQAWYLHGEYMYKVNSWLSLGGISGIRTGYDKPVKYSGAAQVETCYNEYCSLFMISDRVAILNLKYGFDYE